MENNYERLPSLAADLVGRKVDLIVATAVASSLTAKNATSTIPIVFWGVSDPVGLGLVASLARPSGNVTGFGNFASELTPKRLELLSELVPKAKVFCPADKPRGTVIMSRRHGPIAPERRMFEVSAEETIALAQRSDLLCTLKREAEASLRQPGVSWTGLAFQKYTG